ncbi:MAG: hypothetical protein V4807_03880 [Burkholderia gladioli]|uniref:hypothetical protein n=1 Tax=Burkholderia gladioli TaxID=28095 RepID=UPI00163F474F|nr:hypothetical protein [Burkholderia gladioli]
MPLLTEHAESGTHELFPVSTFVPVELQLIDTVLENEEGGLIAGPGSAGMIAASAGPINAATATPATTRHATPLMDFDGKPNDMFSPIINFLIRTHSNRNNNFHLRRVKTDKASTIDKSS